MKKILFSAYSLDVGGIETALITLLKNIKNDYEITLCLEKKEGIFLNELPQNVKIITYKPSNFKIMPIRKILNFIKQQIFKIKYKNKRLQFLPHYPHLFPSSYKKRRRKIWKT